MRSTRQYAEVSESAPAPTPKMNRAQRRTATKKLKSKSFSQKAISTYLKGVSEDNFIEEGDKVTLDMKKIHEDKDFITANPAYVAWVKAHKDKVLTVEYEEKYAEHKQICCFKEDEARPKWLFWTGQLKRFAVKRM